MMILLLDLHEKESILQISLQYIVSEELMHEELRLYLLKMVIHSNEHKD